MTSTTDMSETHVPEFAIVLWIQGDGEAYVPTALSLAAAHPGVELVVGGPGDRGAYFGRMPDGAAGRESDGSLAAAIDDAGWSTQRHVLVVSAPIVAPPQFLDRALALVDDDLRVASVSFLCNAAGALSVPHRNHHASHQIGVHDEVSITRRLREIEPAPGFVPVAVPTGPVVLLSRWALGAVGGVDGRTQGTAEFVVADTCLVAARRGFVNVADEGTYVSRPFDLEPVRVHPIDDEGSVEWGHLAYRHPNLVDRYRRDAASQTSAVADAIATASAKIRGLRIIIDARDLGPTEMGTQVQILSLVRELAARDDVASLQIGIPGDLPAYAVPYLQSQKIRVFTSPSGDLLEAEPADVIHRPSQPSQALPIDPWRSRARRVVITLQDLIAYQVGSYHHDGEGWDRYRGDLIAGSVEADAIVSISAETVRQIELERLPLERSRIFVVPNGTDHMSGAEPETFPAELGARGFLAEEFLLVLGTNYGHKNRDLAIRTWKMLRHSYPQLHLVLAGALVPAGSSRVAEAVAAHGAGGGMHTLPDVSSAERNWLMRHARAVLYPTSAEGFGLVPFEAARFGTPTIGIRFAPLDEFNDPPVWATGWTDLELAAATGRLIESPELAAEQVRATLHHADRHRWSDTAAGLVRAYRIALSTPSRRLPRG